jgi:hypothetical protein
VEECNVGGNNRAAHTTTDEHDRSSGRHLRAVSHNCMDGLRREWRNTKHGETSALIVEKKCNGGVHSRSLQRHACNAEGFNECVDGVDEWPRDVNE